MNIRLMTVLPLAALLMTACGGGDETSAGETGVVTDTMSTTGATTAPAAAPMTDSAMPGGMSGTTAPAPGTAVDTAGTGTNPPTAGGQVVEEGATPSPAGTPTAP